MLQVQREHRNIEILRGLDLFESTRSKSWSKPRILRMDDGEFEVGLRAQKTFRRREWSPNATSRATRFTVHSLTLYLLRRLGWVWGLPSEDMVGEAATLHGMTMEVTYHTMEGSSDQCLWRQLLVPCTIILKCLGGGKRRGGTWTGDASRQRDVTGRSLCHRKDMR